MTWKTLRLFFKILPADDKYCLHGRDNLMEPKQMHLSRKEKTVSQFFCAFLKSTRTFKHSQQTMTLIAYVFLKLRTPQDVVR